MGSAAVEPSARSNSAGAKDAATPATPSAKLLAVINTFVFTKPLAACRLSLIASDSIIGVDFSPRRDFG
jgi:uncharacterized ferredoxin-like protein